MSLADFAARWNEALESAVPGMSLEASPEITTNENGVQTFVILLGGSFGSAAGDNTVMVGALTENGEVRTVGVLTRASVIEDELEAAEAGLEGITAWSTLGRAVNPRLSTDEGFQVLTQLGVKGGEPLDGLDLQADIKGVRYSVIDTVDGAWLIATQAL
jgi:hypothetical protein